jgi:hypothetical protein
MLAVSICAGDLVENLACGSAGFAGSPLAFARRRGERRQLHRRIFFRRFQEHGRG